MSKENMEKFVIELKEFFAVRQGQIQELQNTLNKNHEDIVLKEIVKVVCDHCSAPYADFGFATLVSVLAENKTTLENMESLFLIAQDTDISNEIAFINSLSDGSAFMYIAEVFLDCDSDLILKILDSVSNL